jgi:Domain of unknown function (DUF4112)
VKPPDRRDPLAEAPEQGLAPATDRDLGIPAWAKRLAVLLDGAVTIPGTDFRIGLDPILGLLLPELGDALTGTLSVTLLVVAVRERVPKLVLARMLVNIAIDALLGAIPVIGDAFDFVHRANEKNLALIERHRGDPTRALTWGDRLVVLAFGLTALALLALPIVLSFLLIRGVLVTLSKL